MTGRAKNKDWSVELEAIRTQDRETDEECAERVLEALSAHGPALSIEPGVISVRFDVSAPTVDKAFFKALAIWSDVLPDMEPIRFEATTVSDLERQLSESNAPELLGVGEVAELLHVSRQRASELADSKDFPSPVARLKSGPIWQRSQIARFIGRWTRKPGRPSRTAPARA